jgi:cellulose biosynthesis protein BcsQ
MNPPTPLIIAVASGKGGVGKTMLTVACAHELSLAKRTLLVDLDFFNRGLSGLLREGKEVGRVTPPSFLTDPQSSTSKDWRVIEVAPQLLHIVYPDLLPDELGRLESLRVKDMYAELCVFLRDLTSQFQCHSVVLDCHGGPDRSSFAAVLAANYTLLISEADRITFHGTFNFLRQLKRVTTPDPAGRDSLITSEYASPSADVRLVFNKVLPALSTPFLRRTYKLYLRDEFGGKSLLAIFPLEVYLTKAFEQTPVLTAIYPYSLLARKTRVLLFDLLADSRRDLLSRGILSMPGWIRGFRRRTIGKTPLFLDHTFVLGVIAVFCVAFMVMTAGRTQSTILSAALKWWDRWVVALMFVGLTWLGGAFLLLWSRLIDRSAIRAARRKRYILAILHVPLAVAIWSLADVMFIVMCYEAKRVWSLSSHGFYQRETDPAIFVAVLLGLLLTVPLFREPFLIYRERVSEKHSVESFLRLLFLISLAIVSAVAFVSVFS